LLVSLPALRPVQPLLPSWPGLFYWRKSRGQAAVLRVALHAGRARGPCAFGAHRGVLAAQCSGAFAAPWPRCTLPVAHANTTF